MRLPLGIRARTVLLLLLVFGAAAVGVHRFLAPSIERGVRQELLATADDCIGTGDRLMRVRADHFAEKVRRELLDLPFEFTAGDPAATRALVRGQAEGFGRSARSNVEHLTAEFGARMHRRAAERAVDVAGEFRGSVITGLLVLLAAILLLHGAGLARTVLWPLARLLRATEKVAGGDLDERVGFTSKDEVGRLGRAFDRMTGSLQESRAEIEALNRSLAGKVEEKTRELTQRNLELAEANERLRETVAELRSTRDALVHAEKMASIGRLAGGVAHEFNNLLGGIIGTAEDSRTETDPAEVKEGLDMILRTARRACNITENLLRFSRPPERRYRVTDLTALVREALDLVGPEIRSRGIELRADLDEPVSASVDPGQVHQVVLNLLTNAIRAVGEGGRIEVGVRIEETEAVVFVADSGPGIPEENLSRIFEPFFTTRTGDQGGTGLGLSVSYSIVKAHEGRIEVESPPGRGARFAVRLPCERNV